MGLYIALDITYTRLGPHIEQDSEIRRGRTCSVNGPAETGNSTV